MRRYGGVSRRVAAALAVTSFVALGVGILVARATPWGPSPPTKPAALISKASF